MRKESQRVKRHLSKKTSITEEDRLAAAFRQLKSQLKRNMASKMGMEKEFRRFKLDRLHFFEELA